MPPLIKTAGQSPRKPRPQYHFQEKHTEYAFIFHSKSLLMKRRTALSRLLCRVAGTRIHVSGLESFKIRDVEDILGSWNPFSITFPGRSSVCKAGPQIGQGCWGSGRGVQESVGKPHLSQSLEVPLGLRKPKSGPRVSGGRTQR